jgi:PEP-CTERM motif
MKTIKYFLSGAIAVTSCCVVARGQTIYYDDFTTKSAVSIEGTAPDVANDFAGGTSSALWNNTSGSSGNTAFLANGVPASANQNCTLLDFTPQVGYLYTMTASVNVPASTGSGWIAMGFSEFNPDVATTDPRFTGGVGADPVIGYAWLLGRTSSSSGGGVDQFMAGPEGSGETDSGVLITNGIAGTYTLTIDLNTSDTQWTASAFVNGIQMGTTVVYATNPTIGAAGVGQNALAAGVSWNYWSLSATPVPEPSIFALSGLGLGALLLIRRKQIQEKFDRGQTRLKSSMTILKNSYNCVNKMLKKPCI